MVASWVAGRGNARAARVQADAAAQAHHSHASQQSRRVAYVEVVHQVHEMGNLYRQIPEILAMPDDVARAAAAESHAQDLREAYAPFSRSADVMRVEGGDGPVAAIHEVVSSSRRVYMCVAQGPWDADAAAEYEAAIRAYWAAVRGLIAAMRAEIRATG